MKTTFIARDFEQQIQVEIQSPEQDDLIISLENEEGRIVKMLGINLSVGINRFWFDQPEYLSSGHYYLQVINTCGQSIYQTELIKQ